MVLIETRLFTCVQDDMNRWLHYLQVATGQSTAYEPGRSQTMPEGGGKAKKGFFSLKKK
jgi:hypothetical protein